MKMLLFIVLFFYFAELKAQNFYNEINKQIIYSDDILMSGSRRLSDVFSLITGWNSYTIDGFRWYTNTSSLSINQNQNWILLLNGQRYDLNLLSLKNINSLPVTIDQIDSIVVISSPQLYNGEFTENGLISICTKAPQEGFSIHLGYSTGNETGDPGPYIYTDSIFLNVEELGPDHFTSISYRGDQFWGQLNLISQTHSATDTKIFIRQRGIQWKNLETCSFSPSLILNLKGLGGYHQLITSYSTSENISFLPRSGGDLIFFNPAGKEFPVLTSNFHIGLNGNYNLNQDSKLNYKLQYSKNEIKESDDLLTTDFDWNNSNLSANLEYSNSFKSWDIAFGSGFEQYSLKSKYLPSSDKINLYKFYSIINFFTFTDFLLQVNSMLVNIDNHSSFKVRIFSHWQPNKDISLKSSISYSERMIDEDNSIWTWSLRGYDYLNQNGYDYSFSNLSQNRRQLFADLSVTTLIAKSLILTSGISFNWFNDWYLENYQYNFDETTFILYSPTRIFGGINGNSGLLKFELSNQLTETFHQNFSSQFRIYSSGSEMFLEELLTLPKYKISYKADFEPFVNFSLWTMITYISPTEWMNYQNIDIESNGIYKHKVDGLLIWNFAVQKYFWEKKIRASVLFENILNNKINYHPLGAYFDLSIHFKFELLLDSIF
ncbi:MAG: hypothetical protein JXA68_03790 [Ignavibacteriales bacterium]|nr:hypothetical protein [Ignavibacteriales bacterium]